MFEQAPVMELGITKQAFDDAEEGVQPPLASRPHLIHAQLTVVPQKRLFKAGIGFAAISTR
ncbi:hypothetical protein [Methylocaldum szegediense]|uniref:hypothetical protein n=1 Tax=Methylocaldum szegediense TaxID=73780 RepID=UPI0012EB4865|nr:hypothetical protein [Methylocaldum szegediense]